MLKALETLKKFRNSLAQSFDEIDKAIKELEELKQKEQTERVRQSICVLREVCLDLELIMGAIK